MRRAVAVLLLTQTACSWFRGVGETTITTPYGTVQHKGPYVPDPAPTTFVTVYCGTDAGSVALDAAPIADAGGQ